ncbi:MAG: selenocysteine-specific translation elongation factor [Fusobacterium sp. JB021]|nr:selenocysteine-specific translation elongation factor [Fusobacterium sp. JB021]MDP0506898.1 selenocysteine-specific translation elongation factor [Fusobacterium sp. JB019]
MKNIIIGTSGHIDHGKTTLIKNITGIDTDRLPEEKKRGMTIDIGFSFLEEEGRKIGIIDVPGHEKFIKNMVAGASGINYLILVIALDDGIMPQTREHFNISKLLGVKKGIIVLTKRDLVSKDRVEEVKKEIHEEFKNSFLENAKIFETSLNDKKSYEDVRKYLIKDTLDLSINYEDEEKFKMYIDRSFSVKGFGTVVTGSIYSGEVKIDDVLNLYPEKLQVKVKGIETHAYKVKKLESGNRCALNISNINAKDIKRGNLLTTFSNLKPSNRIDVFFILLKNKKIKNNQRIKLYVGTNEVIGRISFFKDKDFAQIKLEKEVYFLEKDIGIIRNFSPEDTLGGIKIINLFGEKTKKDNIEYIDKLKHKLLMKKEEKIILNENKNIYILEKDLDLRLEKLIEFFKESYEKNNLLRGISKIEIKNKFFFEFGILEFNKILSNEKFTAKFQVNLNEIKLNNHKVKLNKLQKQIKEKIFKIYKEAKFSPEKYDIMMRKFIEKEEFKRVHKYMFEENMLVILDSTTFILKGFFKEAEKLIKNYIEKNGKIELKECRELLETDRENAILILEKLDKLKITIRENNLRYIK